MTKWRLSELDPIDEFFNGYPRLPIEIAFGTLCFVAAWLTREFVDLFSNGAGPFSLIFPAIMISTLYGRWPAGLVTFFLAFLHAWYFVLPFPQSFLFENPADRARTIVNGSAALFILFFAELFRAAVRRATRERDAELKTQHMLMRELEHRTKNNFAMVSSLLAMQQRESQSPEVTRALSSAATRVQSFAAIHQTIYTAEKYSNDIYLPQYLAPLTQQLESGLFEGRNVRIGLECDPVDIPRERALAFGLIINELVTNAAKHAFPNGREGRITVTYTDPPEGAWKLSVGDDGIGVKDGQATSDKPGSGLGKILMESFAETAGGHIIVQESAIGTCVTLVEAQV